MTVVDYDTNTTPIPVDKKVVLLFWAPWHEASVPGGPMDTVLTALADSSSSNTIQFGRVQAEDNTDITDKFNVTAVPTFVLLNENNTIIEKIEGCEDVAQITQAVQRLLTSAKGASTLSSSSVTSAINENNNNTASLTEEERLNKRLHNLTRSAEVMVFMKGTPTSPKCGFSRQIIEILQQQNIPFNSFDILTDESVRQGLKSYSNWPTYPQIYVKGELIGGLDIVKEMMNDGPLADQWNVQPSVVAPVKTIEEKCKEIINQDNIMLFMKGLPSTPRCGFSRQIVEILDSMHVEYGAYDILQDEEIRQGLKTYSNWPTYPQLYVYGELIGGLDIVKELYNDGTLKETLLGG